MLDPMILVAAREMLAARGYELEPSLSYASHLVLLEIWSHGGDPSAALALVLERRDGVGNLIDWTVLTEQPLWKGDLSGLGDLSRDALSLFASLARSKVREYETKIEPDKPRRRGRPDLRLDALLRWTRISRELDELLADG